MKYLTILVLIILFVSLVDCGRHNRSNDEFEQIQHGDANVDEALNFLGSKGFSSDSADRWDELKDLFNHSLVICQISVDEASVKLKELFDQYSEENLNDDIASIKSTSGEDDNSDLAQSENDAISELEDLFQEAVKDASEEPFLFLAEDDPKFRKKYVRHAESVLRALTHACSSLPKVLPKAGTRKPRSPEETMRLTVFSLTRWTERWVDYIETRLDTVIDICLENKQCKPFLIKSIERLISHLQNENENTEFTTASTNILQELLNEISIGGNLALQSLSNVQKIVLADYFDQFHGEEESAFNVAGNLHNVDGEEPNSDFHDAMMSSILKMHLAPNQPKAELEIETKKVVHTVLDTFLSVAIDSHSIKNHFRGIRKKYSKLIALATPLSPSVLRVGGSDANFLTFDPATSSLSENEIEDNFFENKFVFSEKHPKIRARNQELLDAIKLSREQVPSSLRHPKHKTEYQLSLDQMQFSDGLFHHEQHCQPEMSKKIKNFTMTGHDLDFIVQLTRDLDWPLLFGLNQLWRDPVGNWDPTNAKLIMDSLKSRNTSVIWQLGNEPNSYKHCCNWSISPEQAAEDYRLLRKEFGDANLDFKTVGPDVTRPRHVADNEGLMDGEEIGQSSMRFLERFLEKAEDTVDAITFHQYYLDGKSSSMEDFISPEIMDLFPKQLEKVISIRDQSAPHKPIWITETASAWGGGAPGISNSFIGGFYWLDKLGAAALGGASMVIRQTLYGGCYSLLDHAMEPVPSYWVSLLHKMLVGQNVLLPRMRLAPQTTRVYSQCLNSKHKLFKKGAIVIFGINVSSKQQAFDLVGEEIKKSDIFTLELTAPLGDLVSRHILLNGKLLELTADGNIPEFNPRLEEIQGTITFQPYSMTFFIVPDAGAEVC